MRTRPDLQVYCAFLASRIHECNTFDMKKVHHFLSFIKHTKYRSIILRSKGTILHFSMDASYNIHQNNNRSHSGIQVTLGDATLPKAGYGGPIPFAETCSSFLVRSRNHSCVCISPTDTIAKIPYVQPGIRPG